MPITAWRPGASQARWRHGKSVYAQCHDPLCASIRVMLGRRGSDVDFIDEIAARVWYRLVDNDGELLSRFSPERGARLITFMCALAKDEVCRHARNEVRRRDRELVAAVSAAATGGRSRGARQRPESVFRNAYPPRAYFLPRGAPRRFGRRGRRRCADESQRLAAHAPRLPEAGPLSRPVNSRRGL